MARERVAEPEVLNNPPATEIEELLAEEAGRGRERLAYLVRDTSGKARVEVFDDWMSPDLRRGDVAYLDDAKRAYAEGIYAFRYQGKPHIKRITFFPNGKLCLSVNERTDPEQQYPAEFSFNKSIIVMLKEIEVIGRVVFAWRNMDGR